MIIKIPKGTAIAFRNPQILCVDTKRVTLERALTNLYMKIFAQGAPLTLAYKKEHDIDSLEGFVKNLEDDGLISGASENLDAIEDWLRSSLLDMIYRGNMVKEKVATLRPMHLLSFRVQNKKYCRDYNTSDQLYVMLRHNKEVLEGLSKYLSKGWDKDANDIVSSVDLDVDTAGILFLTKNMKERKGVATSIDTTRPFLVQQTEIFNDDIRRLLMYQDKLPRSVFIDYLKILCGFHLALYTMKLVYLLPKMVEAGTKDVKDDWSMVVDATDNLDSLVSKFACKDAEIMSNSFRDYVRATYKINIMQKSLSNDGKDASIENALDYIHNHLDDYKTEFKVILNNLIGDNELDKETDDETSLSEMLQYFDETDYFNKYVYIMEKSNLGTSQYKYLREFLDAVSMKNSASKLLADGRSRRHSRRGAIGSKLLETLVQILVLNDNGHGGYYSESLSISELAARIRNRYGLIIDGIREPRFANADVETNEAFKENMDAFKDKLRQIGFYSDLSDAYILQKIRPRYNFDEK